MYFLHQRGKAFAFYTSPALYGVALANIVSGFIVSHTTWPVQFWWVIGLLGFCVVLVGLFLKDTTYPRKTTGPVGTPNSGPAHRIVTLIPVRGNMERYPPNNHGPFDSILIALQPPTLLAGVFIMLIFSWSTAVLLNLAFYLQSPSGPPLFGHGFTPQQNAWFTVVNVISTVEVQLYGYLLNDRAPLWRCRRNGGIWRPEFRLWPLLAVPMVCSPVALGIFGVALVQHYHYMVLAFAVFLLNMADIICLPLVNAYVVECFVDYAAEVTTILAFYRLIFGLCVNFFLPAWTASMGLRWTYGSMAFFVLIAYSLTLLLEWKGAVIRQYSMARFKSTEAGEKWFATD